MSAIGTKQTLCVATAMSAFGAKAGIAVCERTPGADGLFSKPHIVRTGLIFKLVSTLFEPVSERSASQKRKLENAV